MTDSSLLSRLSLLTAAGAVAMALGALSACQAPRIFPGADETIRGAGVLEVQDTVIEVMTEHGFRLTSPAGNKMEFEKAGSRNDELMYGSYGSRPTRQRVTITLTIGDDPESIDLLASGQVVREYGSMSGEQLGQLFAGGATRYSRFLDIVKERVERDIRSRPEL